MYLLLSLPRQYDYVVLARSQIILQIIENIFSALIFNLSALIWSNIQSKSEKFQKDFLSYFVSVFQIKKTLKLVR